MSRRKCYSFILESQITGSNTEDFPKMSTAFLIHYVYDSWSSEPIKIQQISMNLRGKSVSLPKTTFSEEFRNALKNKLLNEELDYVIN